LGLDVVRRGHKPSSHKGGKKMGLRQSGRPLTLEERILKDIEDGKLKEPDYKNKTAPEQGLIREVLFKQFSEKSVNPFVALSSLEFAVFMLGKLYFKQKDGVELTPQEQAFEDRFRALIEGHDAPVDDANSWQMSYLEYQVQQVQQNRETYKQTKIEVTGEF
jgi:hypothetical protein